MAVATAMSTSSPSPSVGIRYCASCLAVYRQDFRRCPLDGASLVVGANDPWVGLTVGSHYVIEAFIGEGAMGRVYRAHHAQFPDRRYAIKLLLGDLAASSQMRARFVLEAEHASRLVHPNVVGVTDFGTTDRGAHFMVMDLVEGQTIGALLRQRPMDAERVIMLARQICIGLEYAHERGMIHRDLKPDNILVLREGAHELARIADFGLALSKNDETRLTTTGVVCTPAYAAPEQLRGQTIDQRVDLYALGATMFEMLSGGVLPFPGDVDQSVTAKLQREAPSIHMVAPRVPPALVGLVGRLLSSRPEQRPRSARAVIRALDQAQRAPRVAVAIDDTAPLRVHVDADKADAPVRTSAADRALASSLAGRRWRRAAVQVVACAATLLAVLVWTDDDAPSALAQVTPAAAAAAPLVPVAAVAAESPMSCAVDGDPAAGFSRIEEPLATPWLAADEPIIVDAAHEVTGESAGADPRAPTMLAQQPASAPVVEKRVRRAPVRRRAPAARSKRVLSTPAGELSDEELVKALTPPADSTDAPALGVSGAQPAAAEAPPADESPPASVSPPAAPAREPSDAPPPTEAPAPTLSAPTAEPTASSDELIPVEL